MKILGFIPARGGSKSIKHKNIYKLNNIPLIKYCYNASKLSKIFTKIVCSTDSLKVKETIDDKFIEFEDRPKKLAKDNTNVADVLKDYLKKTRYKFDWVFLIQPTSPFVLPSHFKLCLSEIKKNKDIKSLQTICETPHNFHPFNARIIKNQKLEFLFKDLRLKLYNKQLKKRIFFFGNILATNVESFIKEDNFFTEPSLPIKIESKYCFDFDGKHDIELAKIISKIYLKDLANESKINYF